MDPEKRENVSGYLKKKKGSGFCRIFGNTNLRWFEVIFSSKVVGYKVTKSDKKFKEMITFNNVVDFINTPPNEDKQVCEWRFGFQILTKKKRFILFCQTENEHKKWCYAFDIILKRVPEAFPKIKESLFRKALDYFYKPYIKTVEAQKKKKLEEEREKQRQEEERRKKIKEQEEEEKRNLMLKKQKEAKEEEMRLKVEEERRRLEKEAKEAEKSENKLYDLQHESILFEASENILGYADECKEDGNYSTLNKSLNKSLNRTQSKVEEFLNKSLNNSALNFKDDFNDWNFYNDFDEKINEDELILYNPISKETYKNRNKPIDEESSLNNKSSAANEINNLFRKTSEIQQITLNITSTKEDFTNNQSDRIEVNSPLELESNSESTNTKPVEYVYQVPKSDNCDDKSVNQKYKKPKYFKKQAKTKELNISAVETSYNNNELLEQTLKSHVDPDIGKSLITSIPLNVYENNSQKLFESHTKEINKPEVENLNYPKVNFAVGGKPVKSNKDMDLNYVNYVTNPNKFNKEEIVDVEINDSEGKDNWFNDENRKSNNSINEIYSHGRKLNLDSLNNSFNDKKNFSINYNDDTNNEMNLSLGELSIGNYPLDNSFTKNDKVDQIENQDKDNFENNSNIVDEIFPPENKNNFDSFKIGSKEEGEENHMTVKKSPIIKKVSLFEDIFGEDDEFEGVIRKKSVNETLTADKRNIKKASTPTASNSNTSSVFTKNYEKEISTLETLKRSITKQESLKHSDYAANNKEFMTNEILSGNEFSFEVKEKKSLNESFVEDFDQDW